MATILVGMSGGVDSSVTAALLKEQGHIVIGGFMKNWSDGHDGEECSWRTERRDAIRVAAQLGIELHTFDFEDQYREHVYEYMIREYQAGRTPNPDVLCNKYMKFGFFLEKADELGCDFVATGHYARKAVDDAGMHHLLAGVDSNKDQSYFLCRLNQEQLSRALFPIGEYEKPEVRKIAERFNLSVAQKKDSQGICFVGKVEMKEFLKERIEPQQGDIVTTSGEIIGQHDGHMYYTIGQRSGLGIGGGTPYFIVEKCPKENQLVVAIGEDDPALYSISLTASDITEAYDGALNEFEAAELKARIRYRQPLQEIRKIKLNGDKLRIEFTEKQKAVAPGQFVAIYKGDELLGSAIIESATH
jgi:tRNA-specific 2-thiouridylase